MSATDIFVIAFFINAASCAVNVHTRLYSLAAFSGLIAILMAIFAGVSA